LIDERKLMYNTNAAIINNPVSIETTWSILLTGFFMDKVLTC
jgi:hypothetical protein